MILTMAGLEGKKDVWFLCGIRKLRATGTIHTKPIRVPNVMSNTPSTMIVGEHRAAAMRQRKVLADPKKARAFLVRAGILEKGGKRLAKRYR